MYTSYNIILLILSIISISLVTAQGDDPLTLAFFSSPAQGAFTYTRINLADGSYNLTIHPQQNFNIISVFDYDGVNWYDFLFQETYSHFHATFAPGSFSDLGYGFISFSDFDGPGMGSFNFTVQPIPIAKLTGDIYLPAWNIQNHNLDVLTFGYSDPNETPFYYNRTGFVIDPNYTNSIVAALDQSSGSYFINYVANNVRSILVFDIMNTAAPAIQYKFTQDAASGLSSQIYLFYTTVTNTLFMVDTGKQHITLIAIALSHSTATAQSKIIYQTSNAFGSSTDGLPFVYIDSTDRYVFLLSKPTSAASYTITKFDLTNLQVASQITTTAVTTKYNTALWYS